MCIAHGQGQMGPGGQNFDFDCQFVCVEVLRPSQPDGVMSSMFTGHA